jgi:hypothetical protein
MQSEFSRLQVTTVTNDEVQEYHTELFAFDPIWRIDEWCGAMLANPNHTRKFSKQDAISIAKQFLSARESMVSLKEPCLGCAVIKALVKIGVGIGHTATGGKCLRGSMKIGGASAMASEYKRYYISAWARAEYGNSNAPVGIVCKPTHQGSIVEVKSIERRSLDSKIFK